MKIRFYLALAAAALVMTNCSKEEEPVQEKQQSKGFTATIEGASRSAVTDAGVFSWTAGDKISVWNGTTFDVYTNSEGNESAFVPENEENAGEPTGYAIYPAGSHNVQGEDVTINLPASYTYGSTNAAMLATFEEGSTNLAFKHLGGIMRFVVKNVPVGASKFVFTTTNNIITGNYSVVDGQIHQDGENEVNNNNSVTITFEESEIEDEMVFYVPLPVGRYGKYTVQIENNTGSLGLTHTSDVTNTIGRRTLLLMPEFKVEDGELKKGEGNVIPVTQEEAEIGGNQSVTIDAEGVADANATLVLNYTPSEGNATLNITDGSNETTPQTSEATVQIKPQGDIPVEELNINTPTLTVELGEGEYGTVEALTATQTLIIGEGVTIETLVWNGGALDVDPKAIIKELVVNNVATENSDYVVEGDTYTIKTVAGLFWLAKEVNGGNTFSSKTVVLGNDIDLCNLPWTPIGNNCNSKSPITFNGTFDGNEKTISNLNVDTSELGEHAPAGLFGYASTNAVIKDLSISNVKIKALNYAGAVVGYLQSLHKTNIAAVQNCSVEKGSITVVTTEDDHGNNAGGIAGYTCYGITIDQCSVKDITITGYRDMGGIAGTVNLAKYKNKYVCIVTVTGNTVTGVTINQDTSNNYKGTIPTTIGEIYGRLNSSGSTKIEENNTYSDVTINAGTEE